MSAPVATYRPSTADLGFFFAPRHHELAARLVAASPEFIALSHDPADAVRALGASGLFELLVPREGSASIDVRSLCLAREMLGYGSPLADSIFAVQGLGAYPIAIGGSDEQRATRLPRLARGEAISAFALTEPEAGSDVASMRTTAVRSEDGASYVLSGEKTFISNAGIAAHYVVFAKADPGAGRRGISAFLVDADAPGLTVEPIPMSVPHPIGRLRFEGCRVPASALLGHLGDGFKIAMRTLDTFRVSVGAAAVGMARRALDESVAYARTRTQFGKTLGEQQTIQGYLAEMATEIEASRLLVLRAALARDEAPSELHALSPSVPAMAKMYATEAAQRVIDRAVQIHGGLGVTVGNVAERLYREIRPLRIYEGTTEIQRLIIARALLAPAAS